MQQPRFRTARRLALALALAGALVGCNQTPASSPAPSNTAPSQAPASGGAPASGPPASGPSGPLDRVSGWQADLTMLVPGMERLHKELYHGVSDAALADAVATLSATVPTATDDELMVGVLRVVGMVSAGGCDAHTGAYIWGAGRYPVESLPLRLWLFGDEVVVVDALPPYEHLIGGRIVSIETRATAEVIHAIDPLVPRDNEQTVRLLLPRFLLIPQVLRGLGLADGGPIRLVVENTEGQASDTDVTAIPMAAYNGWAGQYGLHLPANSNVLYLSRIDDVLWWQLLENGTLYVQYNRTDNLPSKVFTDLAAAMRDPAVDRVALDLRHNFGGELHALDPLVELFQDPAFDQPGRLFVVTGRNTFSGGSIVVARLERDTAGEIVGEPMGGCPTFWSDPASLALPWSGIEVGVADDVAIGVDAADTRHGIVPDTTLELTLEDWLAGVDPVLGAFSGSGP